MKMVAGLDAVGFCLLVAIVSDALRTVEWCTVNVTHELIRCISERARVYEYGIDLA